MLLIMERVSDNKRAIGFSCGDQFTMTPILAFKVQNKVIIGNIVINNYILLQALILFCRFFILIHKFAKTVKQ